MANYRFKLNQPKGMVLKLDYIPQEGETVTIYGKVYIIEKIASVKGNFYRMIIREEVRTPIIIKSETIWQKIIRRIKK